MRSRASSKQVDEVFELPQANQMQLEPALSWTRTPCVDGALLRIAELDDVPLTGKRRNDLAQQLVKPFRKHNIIFQHKA